MAKEKDYVALEVCARIRDSRLRLCLTQSEYAEELGVTRQAVSNYENGTACPSVSTIAKALEIDPDVRIPTTYEAETAYRYRHPYKFDMDKARVDKWMVEHDIPEDNWPKWN